MKARIVYIALALVLVFSLAAVVVPAGPVMADESDITIEFDSTELGYGSYETLYGVYESHASVRSDPGCGVSSGTVDMTNLAVVYKFAGPWGDWNILGGFVRGDWSATLDGKDYIGTVTGYIGVDGGQYEVWGIFYDDTGPNDIEGRFNMRLDIGLTVQWPYTIEITWKDGRQCYCELDMVGGDLETVVYPDIQGAYWAYINFSGDGTSTGYYDGPIAVTAGHETHITMGGWLPEGVINEGYAVLDYTCDLGGGQAKGYNRWFSQPAYQKDLKFEGAIEASARGTEVLYNGPLTLTMRHCAGGPCITEEPQPAEGPCFIATAAYGTSTAEEIDVLRAFRDEVLLQNSLGSQLVDLYYDVSPPVADFISENSLLRTIVRELVIDPMLSVATFTQAIWGK